MAWTKNYRFLLGKYFVRPYSAKDSTRTSACIYWMQQRQLTTKFPEFQNDQNLQGHDQIYKFSLENPDRFWSTLARSRLQWTKDFDTVKDCDIRKGHIRWFLGGQLNASVNCVDRHLDSLGDSTALIWEKDEPGTEEHVTYKQLSQMVNRIANMLKNHGVKKGDRVAIYLPTSPVAIAAMLACARIGAVHSVVFAGFSAEALAGRIQDADAETVITADEGVRGGRSIPLKKTVDEAVSQCPSVKRVFVYQRTGNGSMGKNDFSLDDEMAKESDICEPEQMESEDYLFMLYTSGSTGKPKGIAHSTAGYLLYALMTQKHVFDYKVGERFGCVADIGWITGHSYVVYGPLLNGATTVLFESTPIYPDAGRYWEMTERLKLNHMYLAPTALRMILKEGDKFVTKYNRSSLRKLGCVGEPLNHEAFEWYRDVVGAGKCDVVDTWWQTETGGICITPRPSEEGAPIFPAMPMRPFYGIAPALVDQNGKEVTGNDAKGALCIKSVWPGMARTIYGDHNRFLDTYYNPFPGYYFSGDGARRTADGYYQITGRMDDVLNISGHRLGTAEIEDVLDDQEEIAESAVVGYPHDVKGEGIYAFVVLKGESHKASDELAEEMRVMVKTRISSFAQPDKILFTPGLPKTRSGKIMRRILRKIAADKPDELGDTSTLFDPSIVDAIVNKHQAVYGEKKE
ncbi:acetyl-coenzyme A synthetase 2-like, mitochondrial [Saccostrea echinata]|uniref:acetyl-coenzyme A synthetase 2-like, mitochondrial n=1 Tax=Saccostrea echinata TaxID=191078 RepID=UPI002A80798D|nr:acetyl-coenzyme A synthetase 2-like, mitochondrial [Saccostrea echinata]